MSRPRAGTEAARACSRPRSPRSAAPPRPRSAARPGEDVGKDERLGAPRERDLPQDRRRCGGVAAHRRGERLARSTPVSSRVPSTSNSHASRAGAPARAVRPPGWAKRVAGRSWHPSKRERSTLTKRERSPRPAMWLAWTVSSGSRSRADPPRTSERDVSMKRFATLLVVLDARRHRGLPHRARRAGRPHASSRPTRRQTGANSTRPSRSPSRIPPDRPLPRQPVLRGLRSRPGETGEPRTSAST